MASWFSANVYISWYLFQLMFTLASTLARWLANVYIFFYQHFILSTQTWNIKSNAHVQLDLRISLTLFGFVVTTLQVLWQRSLAGVFYQHITQISESESEVQFSNSTNSGTVLRKSWYDRPGVTRLCSSYCLSIFPQSMRPDSLSDHSDSCMTFLMISNSSPSKTI